MRKIISRIYSQTRRVSSRHVYTHPPHKRPPQHTSKFIISGDEAIANTISEKTPTEWLQKKGTGKKLSRGLSSRTRVMYLKYSNIKVDRKFRSFFPQTNIIPLRLHRQPRLSRKSPSTDENLFKRRNVLSKSCTYILAPFHCKPYNRYIRRAFSSFSADLPRALLWPPLARR